MGLVENIKKICNRKNILISELEKRAGLPANAIYKWNRNDPGVKKVAKAAAALGVTVDELVKEPRLPADKEVS